VHEDELLTPCPESRARDQIEASVPTALDIGEMLLTQEL